MYSRLSRPLDIDARWFGFTWNDISSRGLHGCTALSTRVNVQGNDFVGMPSEIYQSTRKPSHHKKLKRKCHLRQLQLHRSTPGRISSPSSTFLLLSSRTTLLLTLFGRGKTVVLFFFSRCVSRILCRRWLRVRREFILCLSCRRR